AGGLVVGGSDGCRVVGRGDRRHVVGGGDRRHVVGGSDRCHVVGRSDRRHVVGGSDRCHVVGGGPRVRPVREEVHRATDRLILDRLGRRRGSDHGVLFANTDRLENVRERRKR